MRVGNNGESYGRQPEITRAESLSSSHHETSFSEPMLIPTAACFGCSSALLIPWIMTRHGTRSHIRLFILIVEGNHLHLPSHLFKAKDTLLYERLKYPCNSTGGHVQERCQSCLIEDSSPMVKQVLNQARLCLASKDLNEARQLGPTSLLGFTRVPMGSPRTAFSIFSGTRPSTIRVGILDRSTIFIATGSNSS